MSQRRFAAAAGILRRRFFGLSRAPAPASTYDRLDKACLSIAVAGLVAAAMILLDPIGLDALAGWSPSVRRVFAAITQLGDSGVYLIPIALALVGLPLLPLARRRIEAAAYILWLRLSFLFASIAVTGLLVNAGKRLIGRLRPMHLDGSAVLQFDPLGWKSAAASFPSGHATTAWCVVVGLGLLLGRRSYLPLAFAATLVCISRVVIGAHFVSDVIAGGLFGGLGTLWYARFLATRRLVFRFSGQGALALRGPGAAKTVRAWALHYWPRAPRPEVAGDPERQAQQ